VRAPVRVSIVGVPQLDADDASGVDDDGHLHQRPVTTTATSPPATPPRTEQHGNGSGAASVVAKTSVALMAAQIILDPRAQGPNARVMVVKYDWTRRLKKVTLGRQYGASFSVVHSGSNCELTYSGANLTTILLESFRAVVQSADSGSTADGKHIPILTLVVGILIAVFGLSQAINPQWLMRWIYANRGWQEASRTARITFRVISAYVGIVGVVLAVIALTI